MSRRRRRYGEKDDNVLSEDDSVDGNEENISNASKSDVDNDDELDVSEYESVEEEARHSSDDEYEKEQPGESRNEENLLKDSGGDRPNEEQELHNEKQNTEKDDSTTSERESGDGKEQSDNEVHTDAVGDGNKDKVEDDPAFIPTKGAFFQHDLRSSDQPKGRGRDRKLWEKEPVKWTHDMFVMEEQMPKSRDILISRYGYDIRTRPLDSSPPSDARRSRGRGRGGGGFRGRGRGGRPQRNQQREEYDKENTTFKDDYPALSNEGNARVKHKSRSYYNRNAKTEQTPNQEQTENAQTRNNTEIERPEPRKNNTRNGEWKSSDKPVSSDKKSDEKFQDILDVINNRAKTPSNKETEQTAPNSRKSDRYTKSHQSATFSNYQEAPKPRRYSSLRQRQTNSPVDKQNSQQYSQRSSEQRYANFSKPVQPNVNFSNSFQKKSHGGDVPRSVPNPTIVEEPRTMAPPMQPHPQHHPPQNIPPTSIPQAPVNVQQPVTFPDPSQANMGAPMDPNLMPMPQVPLSYNPMLNPMYFEAATNYQRVLRIMSQQMSQMNLNMEQLQQIPTSLPPQAMDATTAIPPDPQTLPPPTDMQVNPLLPPVSQTITPGNIGSMMRPPHQALNPPTYFSPPMGMNMTPPHQQQPFPYSPNLVAQQVGGVTYFNTPTQSPPVPQPPNQASPRRNAAIPILAPSGFGIPGAIE